MPARRHLPPGARAVDHANHGSDLDTVIVPAGTFLLTRVGIEDLNPTGDLDILHSMTILGALNGGDEISDTEDISDSEHFTDTEDIRDTEHISHTEDISETEHFSDTDHIGDQRNGHD